MQQPTNKISQFWQELKRRKVVRVITVYAAATFVILELVSIIEEPLRLPDWTLEFVIVLLCIGFIIAVLLSWIYDITPEGIEKTKPVHEITEEVPEKSSQLKAWKIATIISVVIIVGLIIFHTVGERKQAEDIAELEKSIAVLPFEDMSSLKNQEYFCDGIAEEIINALTRIEGLKVIARTSAFSFKGKQVDIREIGHKLSAGTLLEGSVRKEGNRLRITAQLVRASDGSHFWSEQYDRDVESIFDIQTEIALAIAENLRIELLGEEKAAVDKRPTENLEAYDMYLQGNYLRNQGGKENLDKSIEFYKRALEIDPNYALAYSGMAASYTSYATSGISPRRDVMRKAKTAVMKALEIDNTLGEAHAELAWIQVFNDWDWTGGEKGFKRALELNPNDARAHDGYAWLLSFVGRHDEAIQESKRAHELDPLNVILWVRLGQRYFYARDYDKAIEEYRKVLELYPNRRGTHVAIARALSHKGMHNEVIEQISKIEFMPTYNPNLGYIYGVAGKREKALEILNYNLERSKKEFVWPATIAFIYIGLGEKDKAFEWLEKTYEQRESHLDLLKVEPVYDSLRSDPRFQDLVERMNFPD